ncbi:MAG: hypothetical protein PWR24_1513 [Desulfonauticus sp.]|jgi:hypothetical protein|nr:MAG: Uncharacterized protein XD41_0851 [Desulfonauticus sp. 38_4375]MDK2921956.1 hypothetical protein [Desulfonauticus sp.]
MGSFLPEEQEFTLEEQIKALGDEELLDFWEETHFFNKTLEGEEERLLTKVNYEVLILKELKIRSCKRILDK